MILFGKCKLIPFAERSACGPSHLLAWLGQRERRREVEWRPPGPCVGHVPHHVEAQREGWATLDPPSAHCAAA